MTERNVKLLQETLDFVKAYPSKHNQRDRVCGSQACFAGWAVHLAGYNIVGADDGYVTLGDDKFPVHVSQLAREELGLTETEGDLVFSATNTRSDLESFVNDLIAGKDITEEYEDEYGCEDCGCC